LGISIYCAFNWALLAIIGSFSNHYIYRGWDIGYALLFTVISLGLYKMRREAAVGGFLFCLIGLTFGEPTSDWYIIQTLIMLVSYFQAIRGTFAYVRISQGQ
jgi:hypothetical protein